MVNGCHILAPARMQLENQETMSVNCVAGAQDEPAMKRWYLAFTKPRNEHAASAQLARQGYVIYLPLYKALVRTPDGMVIRRGPMFPRYVFFRPGSAGQSIAPVRSTLGVSHIVRFGISPATVDDGLVTALRAFEQHRENMHLADLSALNAGNRVTVCAGPLKGMEGLVSATAGKRVTVLLDVLGQHTRVCVPDYQLQVLAA